MATPKEVTTWMMEELKRRGYSRLDQGYAGHNVARVGAEFTYRNRNRKQLHFELDFRFVREAELAGSDRWSDRPSEEGGVLGRRCREFDAFVAIARGTPLTGVWTGACIRWEAWVA